MKQLSPSLYVLSLLLIVSQVSVAASHGHQKTVGRPTFCEQANIGTNPSCGKTPTAAFSPSGDLFVVYVDGDAIKFTSSADLGKHFTDAIAITPKAEKIYADGENRPKIVIGKEGQIYLSWVHKTEGRYTGDIRFSRSLDRGKSFSTPMTVNDDGLLTSHRFDSLAVGPDGRVHLTWLDKRDLLAAKQAGQDYRGAALYHAVSLDHGASFEGNRKIADHSCECCRISLEFDRNGNAIAFWRHVFDGMIRDHAVVNLDSNEETPQIQRATYDNWQIEACPHHGPDMAIDTQNNLQLFWFTGAPHNAGLFYARYRRSNEQLDRQVNIDHAATASRPQIRVDGQRLILVWKVYEEERTKLQLKVSPDAGINWSQTQTITTTVDGSDHPQMIHYQGHNYVTWWTQSEGFRVLSLHDAIEQLANPLHSPY